MANDKRFVAKNGLHTQNIALVSPNASTITASMLDAKTLSFSGTAGQLFSVTDSMGGTIFAVNDISGVPSLEITDTGTVRIAETIGNVLVGTSTDNTTNKLQVSGNVSISGNITVSGNVTGNIIDSDLGDIIIGTPNPLTTGDILAYDGTGWTNSPDLTTLTTTLNILFDPISRQTDNTQITAISVGTTAPSTPAVGDLWVDTN